MKRGAPEHPKTKRLMRILEVPSYAAVGILESLFHFTARYSPQGNVGRFSDEDIAAGIGWDGNHSELISALVSAGWLDEHAEHRLIVHDWQDHADDSVKKTLKRWEKSMVVHVQKCPENNQTSSNNVEHVQTFTGHVQKTDGHDWTKKVRQKPEARSQKPDTTSSLRSDVDSLATSAKRDASRPDDSPTVMEFKTTGTVKVWNLTETYFDFLQESYPDLDILAECRKAKAYYDANGLKTANGMKRALVKWMNNAIRFGSNGKNHNHYRNGGIRPLEKRELCSSPERMKEFWDSIPEEVV